MRMKGIGFFKARWFVRPDTNTEVTIIFAWNDSGYALVINRFYFLFIANVLIVFVCRVCLVKKKLVENKRPARFFWVLVRIQTKYSN